MDMKVDVDIYLHGKRVAGYVSVSKDEWQADPFWAVLSSINSQYGLELTRFYNDKDIKVNWGEEVGRFDMDMTDTIDKDVIRTASAWMEVDITESGEVSINDSEYVIQMMKSLEKKFPVLRQQRGCHLCYPFHPEDHLEPLSTLVPHFNDLHEWSINEIADWLEEQDLDIQIKEHAINA